MAALPGSVSAGARGARPRSPGLAYLAVLTVLLLIVVLVARVNRAAPPPTIAEFAPTAIEQIKKPPEEQASDVGQDLGITGDEAASEGPYDESLVDPELDDELGDGEEIPPVRRCVGTPPRQTEDPQSPPCVPIWTGTDNGGATAFGVTADEIRIVVPELSTSNGQYAQIAKDLENYFNLRYEFYGRKLRLIPTFEEFAGGDPEAVQAAAAENAKELHKAFASTDAEYDGGGTYRRLLAQKKIISVMEVPFVSEQYLRQFHPYMWAYPMESDGMLSSLGEWLCKRVAHAPAAHAGNPVYRGQARKLGLLTQEFDPFIDTRPLKEQLQGCGVELAYDFANQNIILSGPDAWQTQMGEMRTRGVTSVICLCFSLELLNIQTAATNQGYFPEWIVTPYWNNHFASVMRLLPQQNLFGITVLPRDVAVAHDAGMWAVKEVNPSGYPSSWNTTDVRRNKLGNAYKNLLVLASGIQMAGPNLTPETFAEALEQTIFPNPDHPTEPGKVRFAGGVHSMVMDAAEWWWSQSAQSPYNDFGGSSGAWCYVDGGRRHQRGMWPTTPTQVFEQPCDSGA